MKTTIVKAWGDRTEAYADSNGAVWVYDDVAGHFTTVHSLTPGQLRYVRARANNSVHYCENCGWIVAPEGVYLPEADECPDGASEHRCDDRACVVRKGRKS